MEYLRTMIRLDRNCHHGTPSEGNNSPNSASYVRGGAKSHWVYLNYISLCSLAHLIPSYTPDPVRAGRGE